MSRDLSAKTVAELRTFVANAEAALGDAKRAAAAQVLLEAAKAELRRRGSAAQASLRRDGGVSATATLEAVNRLTLLAAEALAAFDLAPPRATPQPHRFTSAGGVPKVGGRQRSRGVAADRYLSYKNGDRIIRIGWIREHGEPADTGGRWYVGVHDVNQEERSDDFEECRTKFWEGLTKTAPKR